MSISSLLNDRLASLSGLDDPEARARLTAAVAKPAAVGLSGLRSGLFLLESIPLLTLQRIVGGRNAVPLPPPEGAQEAVLRELRALVESDAEHIAEGLYPLSVLAPESSPVEHGLRYLRLLADSVGVALRKRQRKPREFARAAARRLEELPAYYRRNFHFQTDGYLSEASAELYEHQVEILFRGVGDAMRRLVIPPLSRHFRGSQGRGLRLLELGAGCGTATRFVAAALPEARITCVDLSAPYLKRARQRLAGLERVEFLAGNAADLDLRDERFDAVYSVFLFHELPLAERRRVLAETRRVLKPRGIHVLVDSLQRGDVHDLDWALEAFPRQFHEPYFRNYARSPIEEAMREAGFERPEAATGFLSKVVHSTR